MLKLELKEIRDQQDLLFRFMNFLKQEGAVHVLQFCLTVGKITNVLLKLFDDLEIILMENCNLHLGNLGRKKSFMCQEKPRGFILTVIRNNLF